MKKIVILDGYTTNRGDLDWSHFDAFGDVTIYDRTPANLIIKRIADADMVLTNKTVISNKAMDVCKNLRYVGVMATGVNTIDIDAARSKGITVTNVPNYSSDSVSQFVFSLLLEIANGVAVHDDAVKKGEWTNNADFTFQLTSQIELNKLTMGIFGLGSIGMRVATIARAFGMRILAHKRSITSGEHGGINYVDFDTLLAESDVVTIHAPLTKETEGLFDKAAFERMKSDAILINTARGAIINESDLADALNNGHIYAAALDVVSVEPIPDDNPLLTAKNCLITPHMAYSTKASRERLINALAQNLENYLAGDPSNVVT